MSIKLETSSNKEIYYVCIYKIRKLDKFKHMKDSFDIAYASKAFYSKIFQKKVFN